MNKFNSTSIITSTPTPSPLIQKTAIPATSGKIDDNDLPIAAIVCIAVFAYIFLMFLIITVIRCYCSKQCSNLRCVWGNSEDPCCSCMPFKEDSLSLKIITCACIKCDNCCQSKKKIDWVSIIICDKCFGPGGWCSKWCCTGQTTNRVCICFFHKCENCEIECNMDCTTINCLCFTIYNGPMVSARNSQGSIRQSQLRRHHSNGYDINGSNNNGSIIYPPLPSTDRSFVSSRPDSTRTLISAVGSSNSSMENKASPTPRSYLDASSNPPSTGRSTSRSISKSAIAPQTDVQLFAPRGQSKNQMNGSVQKPEKKSSSKKKKIETKVQSLSTAGSQNVFQNVTYASSQNNISKGMSSNGEIKRNTNESRNSVHFSPDLTSSMQTSIGTTQDSRTTVRPNSSSSVISSNSLSATSEALLAQYQLMDAEKLTPRE